MSDNHLPLYATPDYDDDVAWDATLEDFTSSVDYWERYLHGQNAPKEPDMDTQFTRPVVVVLQGTDADMNRAALYIKSLCTVTYVNWCGTDREPNRLEVVGIAGDVWHCVLRDLAGMGVAARLEKMGE